MKRIVSAGILIFCVITSPSVGLAKEVTLREAVNAAMENGHLLKSQRWGLRAQREAIGIQRGNLFPKLSIEERITRTDSPTYGFMAKLNQERFSQEDFIISRLNDPEDISDMQTSFVIEQPLFVPSVSLGLNISKKAFEAGNADYERKRDDVVRKVVQAYLSVLTAREYAEAAGKALDDAHEHHRLALVRFNAGTVLRSDVLRADVLVKKAQAGLVKAEGELEIARRSLGLLIGYDGPVHVVQEQPVFFLDDIGTYLTAASGRSDLEALRTRANISRTSVNLEKSAFLPEAFVNATYNLHDHRRVFGAEGDSYLLMGTLRWKLFDISSYHRIQEAHARAHALEEQLLHLEKEIGFQIHEAFTRVNEKKELLSLAEAALKEAEESEWILSLRYENSLAPMIDLLDVQVVLDNARVGAITSEHEYLNALVQLYFQSGILMEKIEQELPKRSMK